MSAEGGGEGDADGGGEGDADGGGEGDADGGGEGDADGGGEGDADGGGEGSAVVVPPTTAPEATNSSRQTHCVEMSQNRTLAPPASNGSW